MRLSLGALPAASTLVLRLGLATLALEPAAAALALQPAAGTARSPQRAATLAQARLVEGPAIEVDLHLDPDALLFGLSPATSPAERLALMERLRSAGAEAERAAVDRLSTMLRRRLRLRFDGGAAAELEVIYPERRATAGGELATLGGVVRVRAPVPEGARSFTWFASRSFRGMDLRTVIGDRELRQVLEPGEQSAPVALPPP